MQKSTLIISSAIALALTVTTAQAHDALPPPPPVGPPPIVNVAGAVIATPFTVAGGVLTGIGWLFAPQPIAPAATPAYGPTPSDKSPGWVPPQGHGCYDDQGRWIGSENQECMQ